MELTKLNDQLQIVVPEELYNIEPGQIAYFVPRNGFGLGYSARAKDIIYFISACKESNEVYLDIVSTDNELLIGNLAGRNVKENGSPYKVVIGPFETLIGFTAEYLGVSFDFVKQIQNINGYALDELLIMGEELPIVVSLNPLDRAVPEPQIDYSEFTDSPLEALTARPQPGSKEEKKLIQKEEAKFDGILRECYVFDIDLDTEKVKKKFQQDINSNVNYQLLFDQKRDLHRSRTITYLTFDIYVANGKGYKLDLTGMEKAIYLTFLLYPNGIRVKETTGDFIDTCKAIYGALPFADKCEKDDEGLTGQYFDAEVYLSTMRTHLSHIRSKVAKKISNPKTAIEFAIEGYKDQEFGIARSTPEIRELIKTSFGL